MRSKIENLLNINVCGIDLTTLTNIEFYVKQGTVFFQYTPQVLDASNMLVTIPYEDALTLIPNLQAKLQFAFTDNNDNVGASDATAVIVSDLLKLEGYANE